MQQHKDFWQTRRLVALLGAVMLLALLVMADWSIAHAAPESGQEQLIILSANGNTLTLKFVHWVANQPLTLGYSPMSQTPKCSSPTPLPNPDFEVTTDPFQASYSLPGTLSQGAYYLCASDPVENLIVSTTPFYVSSTGNAQLTPAPTPTPSPTNTATTPGASQSPIATSTPGNGGTSVGASSSGNGALIAIIVLCLLVLALLVYLVRLWLRGRQTGGGGQQNP